MKQETRIWYDRNSFWVVVLLTITNTSGQWRTSRILVCFICLFEQRCPKGDRRESQEAKTELNRYHNWF